MEIDYNPQLGYRRTIFHGNYDFLIGISFFESRGDGLYITADTYRGKQVPVKICFFTDTAFRFQMLLPNLSRLGVVAWHKPEGAPAAGTRVDFAVRLSWNNYNGRKYQQAELVDWRPAENVG